MTYRESNERTKMREIKISDLAHKDLLTVKECALLLSLHEQTIYRYIHTGMLKYRRMGGNGRIYILKKDIAGSVN